ncbi:flagellar hook protein FlgE [Vibrio sp.]|nr:flagellar hook protein FlgE [Vibrio sp.]
MSFISLSGLSAAQLDLNATSNNIANANTYGFKESRAEFGDVYSNSLFTNAKTAAGKGVQATSVTQQFHEGSSVYTNSPMDLRISGTGFFAVATDKLTPQVNELTRNGAFQLSADNHMVNANGQHLLGYQVNPNTDEVTSYEARPIEIPQEFGSPKPTTKVEYGVNLPSNENAMDPAAFNFNDPDTYNRSTSSTVYDSLGQSYKMTTYYVKDQAAPNTWNAYYTMTDSQGEKPLNITGGNASAGAAGTPITGHTMTFNPDGTLGGVNGGAPVKSVDFATAGIGTNGGDPTQTISLDVNSTTQFASPFELTKFDENGATAGVLTKIDFDKKGSLIGTYSNGEDVTLARVALARVTNEQGLDKKGATQWDSTSDSGDKIWGESNQGAFGSIDSGVLEQANIDMTQELVDLISAQRNFQANSRSLEVHNQLQQNILQIR